MRTLFAARFVIALACLAWCAMPVLAQQNIFNVPATDIVDSGELFFQQQFTATRYIRSSTTVDFGLGNNMEVGFNIFNLDLVPERESLGQNAPLFLVNFQKDFEFNEFFSLAVGTQLGQTVREERSDIRLANFTYVIGETDCGWGKFIVGGYFANSAYRNGFGEPFGVLLGYDIPLIRDRFHLVGDWITGNNGDSVAVVGAVYHMTKKVQISFGAQLPSPRSPNPFGAVLELTYEPGKGGGKSSRYPLSYE